MAPAGARDAQSAVVSAALSCQDRRGRTAQRGRPSRVIPPREGVDRCKRRTPRESPGSSTAAGSPAPSSGRPARAGGVICKGNGGSLRLVFLVIRVAFLAVERRGSESGVGAASAGVGGRSGSDVGGSVRDGVSGSVWPPHACTNSAAHLTRGASPPTMAGRHARRGAVRRPEERRGTLRSARER